MAIDVVNSIGQFGNEEFYFVGNFSCETFYLPTSIQLFESLGNFGVGLVTIASALCAATVYLGVDACSNICYRQETTSFKINACTVLSVYPIASLCSLTALALPRSQLLAEALTSMALTIALYRLYALLQELGRRRALKAPQLALKVGPCCCWPCLEFPTLEMNDVNLFWLHIAVLQFPIVQGIVCCVLLIMSAEAPVFANSYGVFLQPFVLISILLAIYGLTVVTKSLHAIAPEAALPSKTLVVQLVLLFSKLQGFIIKSLVGTGLFPCDPPLTPHVYANVTYDALMVIEMLLLCYAARLIYAADKIEPENSAASPDRRADANNGGTTAWITGVEMMASDGQNRAPNNAPQQQARSVAA
ncbi:organic solute transporter subunit alpha-like [Copidosoma floridanum]|uniref:organic solute transporter subunit alpha-like n=1 Tax=Copidosoma floridanum TaxID=29053 RepID=UPI000C6F76E3|nr:organic solute transporter subunit alpha-like [Copidosoma floridanum]